MGLGFGYPSFRVVITRVDEPSLTALEKIAKVLNVKLSDIFDTEDKLADVNSYDASLMEKIKLAETLNEEEKKMVFSFVDALVGKKKLKIMDGNRPKNAPFPTATKKGNKSKKQL
jgi:DNA-binding XRE family transcriptional regulator